MVGSLPSGYCLEILNPRVNHGRVRHALFDFDGTLSLIREGWQQVMVPMMVEVLLDLRTGETEQALFCLVRNFVDRLTGKQTIYQMIQLCKEVHDRGGRPLDPLQYKWIYLERLYEKIAHRVAALKSGQIEPAAMMVPGSLDILELLQTQGVICYLASGTDEPYVLDEARALGIASHFAAIEGALDDYQSYSKQMVIDRIITENHLSGSEFVAFGDGFVEIENTKEVGGIAVGVASSEATRCGIDQKKRVRLIQAGADVIVPDFRELEQLGGYLFGEA
jgi:phosphoglycolate phosphatase